MKSLKINILANVLIKILNIVFPLITGPYIARVLSKNDFGYYNIANSYLSLFLPLATFGIYNYAIREISKIKDDKNKINKQFSTFFYFSIISVFLFTTIYYLYFYLYVDIYVVKYIGYILGIQLIAQIFYIEWMNEAFENYTFILYKTLIVRILLLVGIFVFIKAEDDIIPYSIVMTLITLINYLISFFYIKKDVKFTTVRIVELIALIKKLIPIILLANANILYTILDRLFISAVKVPEYVSYYTLSQNLVMIITGVLTGFVTANIPRMGYYLGNNDEEEYTKLLYLSSKIFYFLLMPCAVGLTILAPYAMLIYAGDKYIFAGTIATIFAFRIISFGIEITLVNQIIFVKGYEVVLTKIYFLGGFINLVLNSILYIMGIKRPEFYILTTLFSEYICIFVELYFIQKNKLANLIEIFKIIFKYLLCSITFVPIYFFMDFILKTELKLTSSTILFLLIYIFICFIVYIGELLLIKDDSVYYIFGFIRKIFRKVRRKKV